MGYRGAGEGDRRARRGLPAHLPLRLLLLDYYSIAARAAGFHKTLAAHPGVRLAATDRFLQPREAYDKTIAMLRAHPNIKGLFAVWGDPAMQAVAAAKALGWHDWW